MSDIKKLTEAIDAFCREREWEPFHNGKDLAAAIAIEAGELQEAFLWKKPEDAKPEKVREELADVLIYALRMASRYGFDVDEMVREKLRRNGEKYPVEKAKGRADKYTEL